MPDQIAFKQTFITLSGAGKRNETIFFPLYFCVWCICFPRLFFATDFTTIGVKPQNETIFHMLFIARVGYDQNVRWFLYHALLKCECVMNIFVAVMAVLGANHIILNVWKHSNDDRIGFEWMKTELNKCKYVSIGKQPLVAV